MMPEPARGRHVDAVEERHAEEDEQAERADAQLEEGVDAERMLAARVDEARQQELPRHMPPMNVPSSTPIETADEPITSCSSWNQTTSYISAAQPLPTNSSSSAGRNRRGVIRGTFLAVSQ